LVLLATAVHRTLSSPGFSQVVRSRLIALTNEGAATEHRAVEVMDRLMTALRIQSIGICDQSQSAGWIDHLESETPGVEVVVDRNAHLQDLVHAPSLPSSAPDRRGGRSSSARLAVKRFEPGLFSQTAVVVSVLLSVTFACGVLIAVAHVLNRRFVAPVYDVVLNLTAFGCAVGASVLLGHPVPAILSSAAILCWLVLARRTYLDRRERRDGEPR
jgi:hypothetical protein